MPPACIQAAGLIEGDDEAQKSNQSSRNASLKNLFIPAQIILRCQAQAC
jgi:hypothetical protein